MFMETDADGIHVTFPTPDAALLAAMRSMCVFETSQQAIAARDVLASGGSWEQAKNAAGPWVETPGGISETGWSPVRVRTDGARLTVYAREWHGFGADRMALHLRAIGMGEAAITVAIAGYVAANEDRWAARLESVGAPSALRWADASRFVCEELQHMEAMTAYLARTSGPMEAQVNELEDVAANAPIAGLLHRVEALSAEAGRDALAWGEQYWSAGRSAPTPLRVASDALRRKCGDAEKQRRLESRAWRARIDAAGEVAVSRVVACLARHHAAGHRAEQALGEVMPGVRFSDEDRNEARPRPSDDEPRGGVHGRAVLGMGIVFETVANFHFRHGHVGGHWWQVQRDGASTERVV